MKPISKKIRFIYSIFVVIAVLDSNINFVKRLDMTLQQIEIVSQIIQTIFKLSTLGMILYGFYYINKLEKRYNERTQDLRIQVEALKTKLFVVKWFRDKETVRLVNHFNANNHTFEKRLDDLNSQVKAYTNDNSIYQNPHYVKVDKESRDQYEKEIITYNEAFKDWEELPKYGLGDLTSIYKGKDYTV